MEELKSTESLVREIEADAQKKGDQIQKDAAETIAKTKVQWQERLDDTLLKEKNRFARLSAAAEKETTARLNLDKRRIQCERNEACLQDAAAGFLNSLDRQTLVNFMEDAFTMRIKDAFDGDFSVFSTAAPVVAYRFLSRAELDGILHHTFDGLAQIDFSSWHINEDTAKSAFGAADLSLVLDMPSVRISTSVGAEAFEMLLNKRSELTAALFGENYA